MSFSARDVRPAAGFLLIIRRRVHAVFLLALCAQRREQPPFAHRKRADGRADQIREKPGGPRRKQQLPVIHSAARFLWIKRPWASKKQDGSGVNAKRRLTIDPKRSAGRCAFDVHGDHERKERTAERSLGDGEERKQQTTHFPVLLPPLHGNWRAPVFFFRSDRFRNSRPTRPTVRSFGNRARAVDSRK